MHAIHELLTQAWPSNRAVNIVCHGHSVPAGYFDTPSVRSLDSYPHLLHVALKQRYPLAVINVIVTAIGGENAASGAARFHEQVLCHRPDVITIDYSLNDRGLGLEVARTHWVSMIDAALARGVQVILLTPTADKRTSLDDPSEPLNQHAEQVRALATQYNLPLVDSLAIFQAYVASGGALDDLMSWVNHPSRAGHQLVADALAALFKPVDR